MINFPNFSLSVSLIVFTDFMKTITAVPGQDVTLTCHTPNNNNIKYVHWSRADLESEYLLVYRNGQFFPANQHPSFKNRVDLQDRQMKDGDVSLILKNVNTADDGTYQCRVIGLSLRSRVNSSVFQKGLRVESLLCFKMNQ
uniref:Ig-like domain-containing protein n=1 Tax=Neolamprologus brichardi TaxID=32507 RepID=A0A3Q4GS65_NEOBR